MTEEDLKEISALAVSIVTSIWLADVDAFNEIWRTAPPAYKMYATIILAQYRVADLRQTADENGLPEREVIEDWAKKVYLSQNP